MRGRYGAILALALALPCGLRGAPPEVPARITAKPGQLVRVVVKADAGKLGTLRNFTDAEAFWGELVGPKGQRQFVFQAPTDGRRASYVVGWWTVGEADGATTTIEIEGAAPPDVAPPPKKKPDDPAPPPTGTYYFLVVRKDGPADPAFTKVMGLPAWAELSRAGHKFKDKTVSGAKADLGLELPAGAPLPCVVTLSVTGGVSKIVREPVPLPTTDTAILELPKAVK
jgi:hypothetical protein